MPRYTVHVRGEWLAVPCRDAQLTVGWLGREAVRRYIKNKPDNGGFASADDVRFLVRRCKGLGLLDNEDPLEVALEDNEFVEVGEWPEQPERRRPGLLGAQVPGREVLGASPLQGNRALAVCGRARGPSVSSIVTRAGEEGRILMHLLQ